MIIKKILCATFLALISTAVSAEDVYLETVEIRTGEDCVRVLAEFNWVCDEFESPAWVWQFERPFWGGVMAPLIASRYDIDGDGTEDVMLKILFSGRCSRGGNFHCSHYFLFGDQPPSEHPHLRSIKGDGAAKITEIDGVRVLIFSQSTEIYVISEIRERTLAAPMRPFENN